MILEGARVRGYVAPVPLRFASEELAALEAAGRRRRMRAIDGAQGRLLRVDGREVVSFSSNDYLGLAGHAALRAAAAAAANEHGAGAGASRLISGNLRPHRELEAELARFFAAPAALAFNSGYQANVGVMQGLAGRADAVYSDALNHASIIDGCRLSRARVHVYPHADAAALRRLLGETANHARRRFIVTDALFSMDGDRAPLEQLAALAREYDAALIVDEAHAIGVMGDGRGLCAELGVDADVRVGTLGKAFGSFGAFAVASRDAIELLSNRARSFVFTTALPPAVIGATRAALALIRGPEGAQRRERAADNAVRLRSGLTAAGIMQPAETTPIIPIHVGDEAAAMAAAEALLECGYYAQGIRPPTVPVGTSRLRVAVSAEHTIDDIDGLVAAVAELVAAGIVPRTEAEK